ncbi:hypothetical protein COLO4_32959 [Corchorus olitorius]|uniref:Uncharacterized protein n=1 Tax=Corchorus olitorius TaxID=93759 RepID=A0A1R3GX44_9ROSI|nr:hypothetical protein COLO4_32959 [Corchorus olitorius]
MEAELLSWHKGIQQVYTKSTLAAEWGLVIRTLFDNVTILHFTCIDPSCYSHDSLLHSLAIWIYCVYYLTITSKLLVKYGVCN